MADTQAKHPWDQPQIVCDFCRVNNVDKMTRKQSPHGLQLYCPKCGRFYGYLHEDKRK